MPDYKQMIFKLTAQILKDINYVRKINCINLTAQGIALFDIILLYYCNSKYLFVLNVIIKNSYVGKLKKNFQ